MFIISSIVIQEPLEVFPEGSGGSGEDPGVGESEQENRGILSHCSLSGTVTHTSANSIMKADRK